MKSEWQSNATIDFKRGIFLAVISSAQNFHASLLPILKKSLSLDKRNRFQIECAPIIIVNFKIVKRGEITFSYIKRYRMQSAQAKYNLLGKFSK